MNIEILPFKSLEPRPLAACADVLFKLDGVSKKARFFINGPDLSAKLSLHSLEDFQNSFIVNVFSQGLNRKWEFNNTFYFTFTGSHFQQEDEKPEWAEDEYTVHFEK